MSQLSFSKKISPPVINIAWHQFQLYNICKRQKYDLLFLPAANRRLPYKLPCPSVGTVHDLSILHVKGKYNKMRELYILKILPFLIKTLTQVITVSESSKKDIIDYIGVDDKKITTTPLAANSKIYLPRNKQESFEKLKNKYNLNQPFILYISRIEHPGKNHIRLIEAFEILKAKNDDPVQLVLAGSDWNRADIVHERASQSSVSKDIIFTGFVADEDLPYFYSAAEIFVFPSLFEGFGLPILEAMMSQVPIACSNISSLPEVAGDGALLFDPYNAKSIEEAISSLLFEDEKRKTIIEKGIKQSNLYSWEKTALQTLEVFRTVLNKQ